MATDMADVLEGQVVEAERKLSNVKDQILKLRSDHLQINALDGTSRLVNIDPQEFYNQERALHEELTAATTSFHESLKQWSDSK